VAGLVLGLMHLGLGSSVMVGTLAMDGTREGMSDNISGEGVKTC